MTDLNARVRVDPDVICTELDDGYAVLLHLGPNECCKLNPTALQMWHLLDECQSLAEVAQRIEQGFDIGLADAERSVVKFASELATAGLIRLELGASANTIATDQPSPPRDDVS